MGRGVESEPGMGGGDRGQRQPPANKHLLACCDLSVSSSDLLPGAEAPNIMLQVQTISWVLLPALPTGSSKTLATGHRQKQCFHAVPSTYAFDRELLPT